MGEVGEDEAEVEEGAEVEEVVPIADPIMRKVGKATATDPIAMMQLLRVWHY